MAKFIPILGQLSGTLSGVVFSHNRNGAYVRARALPINPRTNRQTFIRANFALQANDWASRSTSQQTAWRDYADTMPLVDSLGQTYIISGFNAYVRGNTFRRFNGLSIKTNGPVVGGQAASLVPQTNAILISDSTSGIPNSIQLSVNALLWFGRGVDDTILMVSLGPILNPGVLFFSTPFQFKGNVPGSASSPPTLVQIPTDKILSVGQRLPIRLRWVDQDARVSPPYQEITTVVNIP